jgi:regulator of protease activity HflC (stomatin/prohibitin superfamily)
MTTTRIDANDSSPRPPGPPKKRRRALWGVGAVALLLVPAWLWSQCLHYVPPQKMLVLTAKGGKDVPAGQVLVEPGYKGVQRDVLGEGWHFVTPFLYDVELKDDVVIEPGKVGLVTAQGGKEPAPGQILVDEDDYRGVWRRVLPPGVYRMNPYGYKVEAVDVVQIKPGFVGVRRRLLGEDGPTRFAENSAQKGIVRGVLQPGTYYLNPKEYEVIPYEVGVYQTSYHYDPVKNTAISFQARDGNMILMDLTIEWEVKPEHMPDLVAEFGPLASVQRNVIDQLAWKISRDKGSDYGAQDLLEGENRTRFQSDFRDKLCEECEKQNVEVRSAFIRNIVIPENFLKQKRDRELADETKITNEKKQAAAESAAQVERELRKVDQVEAKVRAETARLTAGIDRDRENLTTITDAQVKDLQADYAAQIADLEAKRRLAAGGATADALMLKETAKGSIHKLKLDAFGGDGDAYLRATLAEKLNPDVTLRLFQSGPGTLWTNLDNKNMTLMLPAPGGAPKPADGKAPDK